MVKQIIQGFEVWNIKMEIEATLDNHYDWNTYCGNWYQRRKKLTEQDNNTPYYATDLYQINQYCRKKEHKELHLTTY